MDTDSEWRRCGMKLSKSLEEGKSPRPRRWTQSAFGGAYKRAVAMLKEKWQELLGRVGVGGAMHQRTLAGCVRVRFQGNRMATQADGVERGKGGIGSLRGHGTRLQSDQVPDSEHGA